MQAILEVEELRATAQHVMLLTRKLNSLTSARASAWEQLLTAAARKYRDAEVDDALLVAMYESMRPNYGSGFSKVWNRYLPPLANLRYQLSIRPNGPNGSWVGEIPLSVREPAPPEGTAVIYVLFDVANQPVYLGSSSHFRTRLCAHRRQKSGLKRFTAYPCRDRDDAYELEDRLLREHKLPMNRRAGR